MIFRVKMVAMVPKAQPDNVVRRETLVQPVTQDLKVAQDLRFVITVYSKEVKI